MNAVPQYDPLTFGETAFKLRTFRQQVLGNNLANSDTPGFKARDIRFADVLKAQLAGISPSNAIPNQPSMDGNTVDGDFELSEFTKNSVFTESALNMLGSTIRSRMSAITGQAS